MMTGEKLLHYTIENLTEENQIFRSFVAKHTQFDKQVSIRILKNFAQESDKAIFADEIRRLAQIQHPNIITLYDFIETQQELYLVFELTEGKSLSAYIKKVSGPIPEDKAKKIFLKILEAFQVAHQYGIMNGAINPNNLIISKQEEVKVLDLAFSPFFLKFLKNQDTEAIAYLSPEQVKELPTDKRSDVYVLGLMLFQMLTGHNPYKDLPALEIKQKIAREPLPDARQFYPIITDKIQEIIKKATDKDPAKRFQDCEEFKAAIEQLQVSALKPQQIPAVLEEEYAQAPVLDVPLYVFIALALLTFLTVWRFNSAKPNYSELISNLQDTLTIKARKDSILKAKDKKDIDDSLKVISRKNTKDSSILYYHRVQIGENLQTIANRFFMKLEDIKKMNDLKGDESLKPRSVVKVWIRAKHSFKRNETVNNIALKYKISDYAIQRANMIADEKELKEGKELIIPLVK